MLKCEQDYKLQISMQKYNYKFSICFVENMLLIIGLEKLKNKEIQLL